MSEAREMENRGEDATAVMTKVTETLVHFTLADNGVTERILKTTESKISADEMKERMRAVLKNNKSTDTASYILDW